MESKGLLEGGSHDRDSYNSVDGNDNSTTNPAVNDESTTTNGGGRNRDSDRYYSVTLSRSSASIDEEEGEGEKNKLLDKEVDVAGPSLTHTQQEVDIFEQTGQKEHATFKAAVFNLANATIGSGVLGLYYIRDDIFLIVDCFIRY